MTRVRWFAVPSLIAQTPTDREWSSTSDAILSGMGGLAQLVLAEAGLPPTTALWLRTGYPQGWQRVSSLAKVPPGDLVVKAVVGQSGGHADCRAKLDVVVHQCQSQPSAQENLTHVRGIRVGYGHAAAVVLQLP